MFIFNSCCTTTLQLFNVGVCKKLEVVANSKGCQDVRGWIHSIVNHLYWSAATSTGSEDTVAKWKSVVNHIQDVHTHDDWHFPACEHGPIDSTKWLLPCKYRVLFPTFYFVINCVRQHIYLFTQLGA